ncbi:MAG TPA: T9SS type A sorting domain-containing protein, partial [Bacteroidales bacterium]|nr:T9SS type A sorting domain-containing protein [Bacteroidales bacterium]
IYLNRDENVAKISIFSISGQAVKVVEGVNPSNGISLIDVPEGLYIISVQSDDGNVRNIRFVKN